MTGRKSSRRAVTHGIFTSALLLRNGSDAEFLRLEREHLAQWNPVGPLECNLVDQLIAADWRLRHAWQTETARLHLQMDRDDAELATKLKEVDGRVRASLAIEHLAVQGRFPDHVHRYQVRFTRQLERISRYLSALQDLRRRKTQRHQASRSDLRNQEPAA